MHENRHILLVEDDKVDAIAVRKAFKDTEITNTLIHASSGQEALKYLSDETPTKIGLILLDLNMPMMNGLEFLKERKQEPQLARIPLIVLTTSRNETDVQSSYELGISGYIVKPVNYNDFKTVIQKMYAYWSICELPE
ncbi:MAG: response regulator [Bacteroidota bacterium]